ncbi:MAG: hypothetical protein HQ518_29940 [Rhodopirellula sp.]|nr:hypothetical protein [Rhodopirellula sp.]
MSSVTWLRSKHGMLLSLLAAAITLVCASHGHLSLAEDAEKPAQGLRGILPDFVPVGLLEDDFLTLGESWTSWSKDAAADVASLYEQEELDVAGQRAALEKLNNRIRTMEKALADKSYTAIFDPLATINGRLSRRVSVATAVLDTLEMNPVTARKAKVDAAGAEVTESVESLGKYLSSIKNGDAWLKFIRADELRSAVKSAESSDVVSAVFTRLANADKMENDAQREFVQRPQFLTVKQTLGEFIELASAEAPATNDQSELRAAIAKLVASLESYEETRSLSSATAARDAYSNVRGLAADGGDLIADVLASNYFNYNLRVVATEAFLNKVAGYSHTDSGAVDDFVLGAKVDGQQTTNGTVAIDLKPNDQVIQFDMTFNGVTQTNTQGVTDQATIFTSGYHTFGVTKSISFDGDQFTTSPATMWVNANNTTTGARTGVSGLPLFGGIADSYAVSAARDRKYQSEAIAADKLRARMLPEFNQEVDAEFSKSNGQMADRVIPKLKETGLFPSARTYRSTGDALWIGTRLMGDADLGGDSPSFSTRVAGSAAIHLHETLLNNTLDKLPLAGESFTEKELAEQIEKSLRLLLGDDFKLPGDKNKGDETAAVEEDKTRFIFPEQDAIRIKAQNGQLTLVLRMSLQPEGDELIPTQEITVPLKFSIEGTDIVIEAGAVGVAAVDAVSPLQQIPRAGIVKAKIQKALPTRKVDRMITLKRKSGGPVDLAITGIRPNAGWLTITIQ